MRKFIKDNKGQVAVEYILMVAVVVAMVTSIMAIIRKKYLIDINKCSQPGSEKAITCKLNTILEADYGGGDKKFQRMKSIPKFPDDESAIVAYQINHN